ncbi:Pvc16 family protein [Sphingomonas sp. HF-S4]|uniref:Pvc16 family protein n=1 Tax=Sphingomonas agrestis TaxID=3080540 RepID=A0ABU3Y4J4_9SPHN|nr:Pvc16 family protein [Sphingomonas sp. HF-S4]MDV3456317.1 Pvc16 family protein [Sphingomonas sp. HF-S4]
MANYRAIAAASTTILGLLRDRFPNGDFGGPLTIELYQAKDFATPMKEGIAICLWRVAPNISRRALGPRTDIHGRRFKPSLPIDLFYLLVPYADDAERQQRLLGWMLRAMHELGPLVASELNHFLAESDIFAEAETLDMVNDPLAIADQLTLWDRIKHMPPAATYAMRMLLLDSDETLDEYPIVTERAIDLGVLA